MFTNQAVIAAASIFLPDGMGVLRNLTWVILALQVPKEVLVRAIRNVAANERFYYRVRQAALKSLASVTFVSRP